MENVYKISIKPLSSLMFKRPSEFHPVVTGPSLAASTLIYPLPSTIAGAVTFALLNSLNKQGEGETKELHEVLSCMDLNFYVGLAELRDDNQGSPGELYYLTPQGLVKGSELARWVRREIEEPEYLRPLRVGKIGIALNRLTKSTREGYLYVAERVQYPTGFSFVALLSGSPRGPLNATIRFGGDQGIAEVALSSAPEGELRKFLVLDPTGGSLAVKAEKWSIVLIAPALLSDSPWEEVIELNHNKVKEIGEMLLKDAQLEVERVNVPKGELPLEVMRTGWSLASGAPKEPALVVPVGTQITVRGDYSSVLLAIKRKLGDPLGNADLLGRKREGWGTAVAVPLE